MLQYIERSSYFHSRYDEAEVVKDGFFVRVNYAFALSLVVTSLSKKFAGNMVVRIALNSANEG